MLTMKLLLQALYSKLVAYYSIHRSLDTVLKRKIASFSSGFIINDDMQIEVVQDYFALLVRNQSPYL